jgi:hypothetical protein
MNNACISKKRMHQSVLCFGIENTISRLYEKEG